LTEVGRETGTSKAGVVFAGKTVGCNVGSWKAAPAAPASDWESAKCIQSEEGVGLGEGGWRIFNMSKPCRRR
jgi:hypothetical protein